MRDDDESLLGREQAREVARFKRQELERRRRDAIEKRRRGDENGGPSGDREPRRPHGPAPNQAHAARDE